MTLVRVVGRLRGRPFCAGFVLNEKGFCHQTAPILRRYVVGRPRDQIRTVFAKMGWKATIVRGT